MRITLWTAVNGPGKGWAEPGPPHMLAGPEWAKAFARPALPKSKPG